MSDNDQTLINWIAESGLNLKEFTDKTDEQKQRALWDHHRANVDQLEQKKDKLDQKIQKLSN